MRPNTNRTTRLILIVTAFRYTIVFNQIQSVFLSHLRYQDIKNRLNPYILTVSAAELWSLFLPVCGPEIAFLMWFREYWNTSCCDFSEVTNEESKNGRKQRTWSHRNGLSCRKREMQAALEQEATVHSLHTITVFYMLCTTWKYLLVATVSYDYTKQILISDLL